MNYKQNCSSNELFSVGGGGGVVKNFYNNWVGL